MLARMSLVPRLWLALWLATGLILVWLMLALVGARVYEEINRAGWSVDMFVHRPDGTPAIKSFHLGDATSSWRTLEGRPLTVRDGEPTLDGAQLRGPIDRRRFREPGWSERTEPFFDGRKPPADWYFLHDGKPAGWGYFVGYDHNSRKRIGYLGRLGFRSDLPPTDERFAVPGRMVHDRDWCARAVGRGPDGQGGLQPQASGIAANVVHVLSVGHLYEVDLTRRAVRDVWPAGDLLSLGVVSEGPAAVDSDRQADALRSWLVLRTQDRIVLFGVQRGDERSYGLPQELREVEFILYLAVNGTAMAYFGHEEADSQLTFRHCRFDVAGQVVERGTVSLNMGQGVPVLLADRYQWLSRSLMLPAPLPFATTTMTETWDDPKNDTVESNLGSTLVRIWRYNWPGFGVTAILSAALAWLCRRRQRRYAQGGTSAWMVFVFLFGPFGWLGYLWHRRWPVLAACPACGRAAPRDREACASCRAEFPLPDRTGAEVFA